MMTIEVFVKILLIVSVITGLLTEAVKKQLDELEKKYHSNLLAGICSVVTGVLVCMGYFIFNSVAFNLQMAAYFVAIIVLSWIAAMVGYDKVVQTINQFKDIEKLEK